MHVFAQEETRLGLPPSRRRRITAGGVPPVATVWHRVDTCYRLGAVEPMTGERLFLELPRLHSTLLQLWWDDFARTLAASCKRLGLDKGAFHTAQTRRWPSHVTAVPRPPSSPELNPLEHLWRARQDPLAAPVVKTLDDLSDTVCRLRPSYSQAALQALTGWAYVVQAIQTAWRATNGSSKHENRIRPARVRESPRAR